MVPERCVLSTQSSDAYPSVFSSAVACCLLSAVPLQPTARPALQGTPVAATSPGRCSFVVSCGVFFSVMMMMATIDPVYTLTDDEV